MADVNWHAYLDGSLDDAEMARAERLLEEDAEARGRLENLRAFLADVRRESLSQPVPLARLHAMIPQRSPSLTPAWHVAALAAALLLFVLWTAPGKAPGTETIATADIASAARWIEDRTGIDPPIPSIPSGRLVASERSSDSGCFCFSVDGVVVHLSFTRSASALDGFRPSEREGHDYYESGGRVAFRSNGLTWIVVGRESAAVWKLARQARGSLGSA